MLAEGSSFSDEAWISCSMEVLGFSSGQLCFMPVVWVAGRMCFGSCRHGVMLQGGRSSSWRFVGPYGS